ncbi:MAG: BON domain-containing protein, partial [Armatimonadia bacterium]
TWLSGRKVLLSPVALGEPDWESRTFSANLTIAQVRDSPDVNTAGPISRQHEMDLSGYYAWPMYWGSQYSSGTKYGTAPFGPQMYIKTESQDEGSTPESHGDPQLRSTGRITDDHVEATDGAIGHVEDCIIDDQSWMVRFLVVETHNWLPGGRRVLIAPESIMSVEWDESKVIVGLSQEAIAGSPEFDPRQPVAADYEGQLHDYYGRPSGQPSGAGGTMPQRVTDMNGHDVGVYVRRVDTASGEAVLIQRAERLGGGTIVLQAREVEQRGQEWRVPYDDLAILEAPPLSPNVALDAYLDFWDRLGTGDMNSSLDEFMASGSGPVAPRQDVPDAQIEAMVKERLQDTEGVEHHLVRVSVNKGTVLLEGYQGDTSGRLAAAQAAAAVPGVKEIVNMLVIRAL